MLRLIKTLLIFLAANALIMLLLVQIPRYRFRWTTLNTDSVLYIMPSKARYDFVMLGTSHGKTFDRGSHEDVEAILGKTFLNLSRGGGGGLIPALIYLDEFYSRGNQADTVLYLLDPYVFYGTVWNENRYFAEDEPLEFGFLNRMWKHGMSREAIWNYVQSKLTWSWFKGPETHWSSTYRKDRRLKAASQHEVDLRIESLYLEGSEDAKFQHYKGVLQKVYELARGHKARLVLAFPPTLLGVQPGQEKVRDWLLEFVAANPGVSFLDGSAAVLEPEYYYNHDHLNYEGIKVAAKRVLAPALAGH